MNYRIKYFIIPLIFIAFCGNSQTSYQSQRLAVKQKIRKNFRDISVTDYQIQMQNLENPFEGNSHYRHFLNDLKKESEKRYPFRKEINVLRKSDETVIDTPLVVHSFEGNLYNYSVPNDNTLAVNKDGIVLSAINTNIIFYDVINDSLLKTISLNVFSDTLSAISNHQYDPKVIYDYQKDRFIVVNLAGASSDNTSHIVVGFQLTEDVLGDWAFYAVPGNPLNDTSWTDFPAISLSNDELFITGNLLRYGGSWQTSFKQSVIWQIDKNSGFQADTALDAIVYSGIKFNGVNIRNLHPVVGGSGFYGPEMYFMSNKNFAITNDTFFLLKTTGLLDNSATVLDIKMLKSSHYYGAPPNPRMPGNKRLATNDARVLGAFYENDHIQYVGNTIDTSNGYATIYHGIIENPEAAQTTDLVFIKSDTLQFGYPNISYCGSHFKSQMSIINFNYTFEDINPGCAVIAFKKPWEYSDLKVIKTGQTYMNVLIGGLQRWGDYSGSQPVYGKSGEVWVSGTFGKANGSQKIYGTWISQVNTSIQDDPYFPAPNGKAYVFPNPSANENVSVVFDMEVSARVNVELVDMQGKSIALMKEFFTKQGTNLLTFSTLNLTSGVYILRIFDDQKLHHSSRVVVAD